LYERIHLINDKVFGGEFKNCLKFYIEFTAHNQCVKQYFETV